MSKGTQYIHTQLSGRLKLWNLKDSSPAVSLANPNSIWRPVNLPSRETMDGERGWFWSSSELLGIWKWDRNGIACGTGPLCCRGEADRVSSIKTWISRGARAWRYKESFWLRETVSKHWMALVGDTIQGRTFWLLTREITRSFESLFASLYSSQRPDLEEGTFPSPSRTDDMYINPCKSAKYITTCQHKNFKEQVRMSLFFPIVLPLQCDL